MASCLWIPFVTGFTRWSKVLGCLPPTGIPRKTNWMPLLTFSETVGELMTEDSLCGAITWCCWCFCGEMRAGKLSVFVHWIRLRTILARSGETNITAVPGSCFFPDIPFSSRRPYFFVYKSFTALSLFPPSRKYYYVQQEGILFPSLPRPIIRSHMETATSVQFYILFIYPSHCTLPPSPVSPSAAIKQQYACSFSYCF